MVDNMNPIVDSGAVGGRVRFLDDVLDAGDKVRFRDVLRLDEEWHKLEAVADAARPVRDWYGLPLIYRREHATLINTLNVLDGKEE